MTKEATEAKRLRALAAKWKRRALESEARTESMRKELMRWRGWEPGVWGEVLNLRCGELVPITKAAQHAGGIVTLVMKADSTVSVRVARRPDE